MADIKNLKTTLQVSPTPTTRVHKDHSLDQVIRDLKSATQTRNISKNLEEHGFVSSIHQRKSHKDLQNCLFACFISQEESKKVIHALKDPSWIEPTQEELLQFKLQKVKTLVDLPNRKRAIGFEDPDSLDRVYKVKKALYVLHQAPRAWYQTLSTYQLDNGFERGKINKTLFIKRYKGDILLVYLKGQPKLGLWYPKDSPFDLVAYTDSDYARASLDRKSTTGEAEYVVASSCCGQVLWIQNQLLDYGVLYEFVLLFMSLNVYAVKYNLMLLVIIKTAELMLLVILNTASSGLLLRQEPSTGKHKYMPRVLYEFVLLFMSLKVSAVKYNLMLLVIIKTAELMLLVILNTASSKRAGAELTQERSKNQKVDDNKKISELKKLMEIISSEEDVAINGIPLAVKSLIVDRKIYIEGKKSYYQIVRAGGKSKMYLIFTYMLKDFDREDLEDLYKLVKAKYGSTRPVEDLDLIL
nr:uncharacterized mitochondrial protein AtMg00810-like [Tanacetum cinerariifolium]